MKNLTLYSDPGHAWLAVPLKDLKAFGLAGKISHYSFMTADHAYLEEDCDAPLYIDYLDRQKVPYYINYRHTDHDSFIRQQARYSQHL